MRYEKLSASLLATLRDVGGSDGAGRPLVGSASAQLRARAAFVSVGPRGLARRPTAQVFITCEPGADLSGLEELGVRVAESSAAVRVAVVPLAALEALSERDDVVSIVASTRARPLLEAAGEAAFLPEWRTTTGLSGEGVVVGVVDTGLDVDHPAFAGRVHSVWDQTTGPRPTAPGDPLGQVLTGAAMSGSGDEEGHGTHVAGIAAGADPTYGGVAPGATIVAVKTTFATGDIAEGVRYVFQVAKQLGMPAVVNLSLGTHNSSHDRADPFSRAIDELSGPGRIVCVAAGNEGGEAIHGQLDLELGSHTFAIEVGSPGAGGVRLNLWYPLDVECAVTLTSPSGQQTAPQGPLDGEATTEHDIDDSHLWVTTPLPSADDPGHNVVIDITGSFGGTVAAGTWRLDVDVAAGATGDVHLWVIDGPAGPVPTSIVGGVSESHKVGSPAAATSAIAVAAMCSKPSWQTADGATRSWGETEGGIATFSSPGPLRDGSLKPDVAAPGTMIISSRSSTATGIDPDLDVAGNHLAMQGTSMACPFVSGLVALMLQRAPTLAPAAAQQQLIQAATVPGQPAGTWDPAWGHGLVDSRRL